MCSIESVELKMAHEKIDKLQREIEDYREFVKSADRILDPHLRVLMNASPNPDMHNIIVMCDYLIKRYHQPTNEE